MGIGIMHAWAGRKRFREISAPPPHSVFATPGDLGAGFCKQLLQSCPVIWQSAAHITAAPGRLSCFHTTALCIHLTTACQFGFYCTALRRCAVKLRLQRLHTVCNDGHEVEPDLMRCITRNALLNVGGNQLQPVALQRGMYTCAGAASGGGGIGLREHHKYGLNA